MKKLGLVALLAVLTLIVTPTIVQADSWSAIVSGYGVTTNYHGQDFDFTQPGIELIATVGFLDGIPVHHVVVKLRDPAGNVVDEDTVTSFSPDTYKGKDILVGNTGPLVPDKGWVVGHYSVKAYFYAATDEGWKELANTKDLVSMRATTQMTVPEVPIGTITILLTMLASLAIFARKRF